MMMMMMMMTVVVEVLGSEGREDSHLIRIQSLLPTDQRVLPMVCFL